MTKGVAVLALLAGFTSGCSLVSSRSHDQSHQRFEVLLWQQAEQIQLQRQNILELQQQREQLQKQIVQLTLSLNNSLPVPTGLVEPSVEAQAPVRPIEPVQVDETGKIILGQVEWAWFDLFGESIKARIDTGAKSSSLYVNQMQSFERDGEGWLRFSVVAEWQDAAQPQERTFEAPLVRRVKVRPVGDEVASRPVVRLTTKVGAIVEDIDYVVHSKSNGSFPVVLGRSFIRDIAVVDVARKFTQVKHTRASQL